MPELLYTEQHEWVRVEENGIATIGISEHAQEQLGDVVYVELPEVGRKIKQFEEAAVVESVKAASEVYAPVSGEVVEINTAIVSDPSIVNRDSIGAGWFMKVKLSNTAELGKLMKPAAYKTYVEGNS